MKTLGATHISLVRKPSPQAEWLEYARTQDAWIKSFDTVISFGVFIQGFSIALNRWENSGTIPAVSRGEAKVVDIGEPDEISVQSLQLRLKDLSKLAPPVGRYFIFSELHAALSYLRLLLGALNQSGKKLFVIGVGSDPLSHLSSKEEKLNKLLHEIGSVENSVILLKTRSPRMVSFADELERYKRSGSIRIVVPVETFDDTVVRRYTPQETLISERIFAAQILRRAGFQIGFQVAPLLPYGVLNSDSEPVNASKHKGHNRDTERFAELLAANCDFLELAPLIPADFRDLKRLKATSLVKRLESDMKYSWLRQDSVFPLLSELRATYPHILTLPEPGGVRVDQKKQLNLFAA